jgi:hypothetical protein
LVDVAPEDRGKIGIDNCGVAARHDPAERTDGMAYGDLGEADLARDFS